MSKPANLKELHLDGLYVWCYREGGKGFHVGMEDDVETDCELCCEVYASMFATLSPEDAKELHTFLGEYLDNLEVPLGCDHICPHLINGECDGCDECGELADKYLNRGKA